MENNHSTLTPHAHIQNEVSLENEIFSENAVSLANM